VVVETTGNGATTWLRDPGWKCSVSRFDLAVEQAGFEPDSSFSAAFSVEDEISQRSCAELRTLHCQACLRLAMTVENFLDCYGAKNVSRRSANIAQLRLLIDGFDG